MNIYHGLLFQSGHIADPQLALRLGRAGERRETAASPSPPPVRHRRFARLRWLMEELVLLGGRPVSKSHVDDLDEPFPNLHPCS